jgi:hypothetical protein
MCPSIASPQTGPDCPCATHIHYSGTLFLEGPSSGRLYMKGGFPGLFHSGLPLPQNLHTYTGPIYTKSTQRHTQYKLLLTSYTILTVKVYRYTCHFCTIYTNLYYRSYKHVKLHTSYDRPSPPYYSERR